MKTNICLLLTFFFGILNAQQLNFSKNNYHAGTIYMEDGSFKSGQILDFEDRSVLRLQMTPQPFDLVDYEKGLGLKNKFYHFKVDEKSGREKISIDEIKKIAFPNGENDSIYYDKVTIARPKNNGEVELDSYKVMLPRFYSNLKIDIYNLNLTICPPNKDVTHCIPYYPAYYLRNKGKDYVVKPFDFKVSDVFNTDKIGERFYNGLTYFGKDCPLFLSKLKEKENYYKNEFVQKSSDRKLVNEVKAHKQKYTDEIKAAKKNMKKDEYEEFKVVKMNQYFDEIFKQYYDGLFDEIVKDYINSCE